MVEYSVSIHIYVGIDPNLMFLFVQCFLPYLNIFQKHLRAILLSVVSIALGENEVTCPSV